MPRARLSDKQLLKAIAARIQQARHTKGLSQEHVAELLEVAVETIRRWETGRVTPDIPTIRSLARILSVDFAWLLGVNPPQLQRGEDELLRTWRGLSAKQRAAWRVLMAGK